MKNNEKIIKKDIFNFFDKHFIKNEKTIIIPEIQIKSSKCYNCGHRIIDLLLISPDALIGFEIKSASDNLNRLKKQLKTYKSLCNKLFVIIDSNKIKDLNIKDYVGIIKIDQYQDFIDYEIIKEAKLINKIKKETLISLVWNIELRFILAYFGEIPMNSKYYSFSKMQKSIKKIKKKELNKIIRFILFKRYNKIWQKIKRSKDFNISKINTFSKEYFQQYSKELKEISKNNFLEVDLFFQKEMNNDK